MNSTTIARLRREIKALRRERGLLRTQVKRWEKKEVKRAACCVYNEQAVERLTKAGDALAEYIGSTSRVQTHSEDCWKWHIGCLVLKEWEVAKT